MCYLEHVQSADVHPELHKLVYKVYMVPVHLAHTTLGLSFQFFKQNSIPSPGVSRVYSRCITGNSNSIQVTF